MINLLKGLKIHDINKRIINESGRCRTIIGSNINSSGSNVAVSIIPDKFGGYEMALLWSHDQIKSTGSKWMLFYINEIGYSDIKYVKDINGVEEELIRLIKYVNEHADFVAEKVEECRKKLKK